MYPTYGSIHLGPWEGPHTQTYRLLEQLGIVIERKGAGAGPSRSHKIGPIGVPKSPKRAGLHKKGAEAGPSSSHEIGPVGCQNPQNELGMAPHLIEKDVPSEVAGVFREDYLKSPSEEGLDISVSQLGFPIPRMFSAATRIEALVFFLRLPPFVRRPGGPGKLFVKGSGSSWLPTGGVGALLPRGGVGVTKGILSSIGGVGVLGGILS
ncbi:hypothetical protein B0H17DRAFT_1140697 [Mycena rosella]|uniref:Uncharacterized protein n=1 Tax=Mycena rosella TaxID=1033263 RepID=A0AAD7D1F0_MYCRO|nr:hypothetical protein B0H17DRAFT_1140697 [Mycena rosella]